jgi:hypothetical protein
VDVVCRPTPVRPHSRRALHQDAATITPFIMAMGTIVTITIKWKLARHMALVLIHDERTRA